MSNFRSFFLSQHTYSLTKKKFLLLLILTVLFVSFNYIPTHATVTPSTIQVTIDTTRVPYDDNYGFPFIDQNSRTQVPFRITLESFGATVGYDSNLKMATATYNDIVVYVPIGQKYIYVNGEKVVNDTQATLYMGRTYCPIRIILEAFEADVEWDKNTSTVVVTRPLDGPLLAEGFDGNYTKPITIPTLALLVSYNDVPLSTSESDWANFFFGPTKSVGNYFSSMSNGRLTLLPASELSGNKNNGIISVKINDNHPNYTAENPNYTSITSQPLFEKIIKAADGLIDFSQYDTNDNGYVEPRELAISIIVAGDEESYYREKMTKAVSGVMVTEGVSTVADSINLNWYTLSGEMLAQDYGQRSMSTIGVPAHEFGHLLGLPDLYDIDASTVGLSFHSLMASGSNNFNFDYGFGEYPAPMIAWSRAYAGLVEPLNVTTSSTYTLFANSPYYNILKIPTSDPKIYYLIENRHISDYGIAWNLYMDMGGIAIWKVDEYMIEEYSFDNKVNSIDDQRGISLIEASGNNDLFKQELDIYYTRYNHYFSNNYVNRWTSPEGIIVDILDTSAVAMNVKITLPE